LVTEVVDVEGARVTLVDTAGLRPAPDIVEAEGVERAHQAQRICDLVLVVVDGSQGLDRSDEDIIGQVPECKRLIVHNKSDLQPGRDVCVLDGERVSAKTGDGIDRLRHRILEALDVEPLSDRPAITNVRHIHLVERANEALARARAAASPDRGALSEEFVLADLQDARAALEEVSGRRATEDLLTRIFSTFCIGK